MLQWEGSRCSGRGHVAVGGVTLQWEGSRCSGMYAAMCLQEGAQKMNPLTAQQTNPQTPKSETPGKLCVSMCACACLCV